MSRRAIITRPREYSQGVAAFLVARAPVITSRPAAAVPFFSFFLSRGFEPPSFFLFVCLFFFINLMPAPRLFEHLLITFFYKVSGDNGGELFFKGRRSRNVV